MEKVKKRGATLSSLYSTELMDDVDFGINIPHTHEIFQPLVGIVPAQMLVVEIALEKGINPDKPKWLTKISSVFK